MSKTLELCNKCWESVHCVSQGDTCIIPLRNFWSSVRFKITWFPVLKTFIDAYGKTFFLQDKSLCLLYFKNNRTRTEENVHSPSVSSTTSRMCKCTAENASQGSPCFIPFWHHCHFTPPSDLCLCFFGLTLVAGCALQHCREGIWTRFRGGVLNVNCIIYCAFTVQIDNLWCIYLSFFRYLFCYWIHEKCKFKSLNATSVK